MLASASIRYYMLQQHNSPATAKTSTMATAMPRMSPGEIALSDPFFSKKTDLKTKQGVNTQVKMHIGMQVHIKCTSNAHWHASAHKVHIKCTLAWKYTSNAHKMHIGMQVHIKCT